jgi:hypothetical protein
MSLTKSIALNPFGRGREWLASFFDCFILKRSMGTGVPRFHFVLQEWIDIIISGLHADPSSSFNTSAVLKELEATIRTSSKSDRFIEWRLRYVLLNNCFCLPRFCIHKASCIKPSAVTRTRGLHSEMVALIISCSSPKRRWSGATTQDLYGSNTDGTTETPQSVS